MASQISEGSPKPPLRRARFTIFFAADGPMHVTRLGRLLVDWSSSKPEIVETTPLPGLEPFDHEGEDSASSWPLPLIVLSDKASGQAILLQGDRIAASWAAEDETTQSYPGFAHLQDEVLRSHQELAAALAGEPAVKLEVLGTECQYVNTLESVHPSEYLQGYFSGWRRDPPAGEVGRDDETLSLTRHYHVGTESEGIVWVSAQPAPDFTSTELIITVRHSEVGGSVPRMLRAAHASATEAFLESTTPVLRREA